MIGTAVALAERAPLPDALLRAAVALLVGRTDRGLRNRAGAAVKFAHEMPAFAIAEHTAAANAQHYEVPAEFFQNVLGPHMKYSCCFYREAETSLGDAEAGALQLTAEHADLRDGQHILELGCGWGSLSLWMAQHYPAARITAVSNSASQRAHIEQQARERGLGNLTVLTADINVFEPGARFDRIVSVEMFEHLSNWAAILRRARGWMKPDGRLFLHVFSHDVAPYRFDHGNKADFIAQHFFYQSIHKRRMHIVPVARGKIVAQVFFSKFKLVSHHLIYDFRFTVLDFALCDTFNLRL